MTEVCIFRLGRILGGRREVLETPLEEAFKYLEMLKDDEEQERFDKFLMLVYSHPEVGSRERQKYIKNITPKKSEEKTLVLETDIELLKKMKAQQEMEAEKGV